MSQIARSECLKKIIIWPRSTVPAARFSNHLNFGRQLHFNLVNSPRTHTHKQQLASRFSNVDRSNRRGEKAPHKLIWTIAVVNSFIKIAQDILIAARRIANSLRTIFVWGKIVFVAVDIKREQRVHEVTHFIFFFFSELIAVNSVRRRERKR